MLYCLAYSNLHDFLQIFACEEYKFESELSRPCERLSQLLRSNFFVSLQASDFEVRSKMRREV